MAFTHVPFDLFLLSPDLNKHKTLRTSESRMTVHVISNDSCYVAPDLIVGKGSEK